MNGDTEGGDTSQARRLPRDDHGSGDVLEGELVEAREEPDVLLDIPTLHVEEIDLDVQDLRARVALRAEVLELLKLNVGVDLVLGRVKLDIRGVDAQALLKVRLDNVVQILNSVLRTIDRNPQILEQITSSVGSAVQSVGDSAGEAVSDVGEGAGEAVSDVGEGAGEAVSDVGQTAGKAADSVSGPEEATDGEVTEGTENLDDDTGSASANTPGHRTKRPRRRSPSRDGRTRSRRGGDAFAARKSALRHK